MNPAKRIIVRLSLVTGSTLATLIGAQTLVTMNAPTAAPTSSDNVAVSDQPQPAISSAPSIAILRHPSGSAQRSAALNIAPLSQTGAAVTASVFQVKPPSPVIVSPAVVMPFRPQTRSTR